MIPFFGNRRLAANRDVIDRLNTAVVLAVRQPAFYMVGGVPDTFNGRFELLVLHGALVVRRLSGLDDPAPRMAQDLVDAIFQNLDPALRELGVGDMAVPKRMKKLAEAFLGRSVAYDRALGAGDTAQLAAALSRNVHGGARPATDLAGYVEAAAAGLAATSTESLLRGIVEFPAADAFLRAVSAV